MYLSNVHAIYRKKFSFFFRLNDMLDEIEDEEVIEEQIDIIIHPPGEGEVSDEEDGDEDRPLFQNLPGSILNTIVETNHADRNETDGIEDTKHPKQRNSRNGKCKSCWIQQLSRACRLFSSIFQHNSSRFYCKTNK